MTMHHRGPLHVGRGSEEARHTYLEFEAPYLPILPCTIIYHTAPRVTANN